ncbi:hypothetical protein LCGC14_2654350 [marine sediment metagenome]|uniref:Uncharacterized protein n=1 Tax=marine sediment metagenome TaxID=412755 RepID=A0A0F8ZTR9_9ZZZZ|nr:hypothetical protein [bacterium]
MYLITTEGKRGKTLFLVDRSITKSQWWTETLAWAMVFKKHSAAQFSLRKLHYRSPSIISYETAKRISHDQFKDQIEDSFHPGDSYALGQD